MLFSLISCCPHFDCFFVLLSFVYLLSSLMLSCTPQTKSKLKLNPVTQKSTSCFPHLHHPFPTQPNRHGPKNLLRSRVYYVSASFLLRNILLSQTLLPFPLSLILLFLTPLKSFALEIQLKSLNSPFESLSYRPPHPVGASCFRYCYFNYCFSFHHLAVVLNSRRSTDGARSFFPNLRPSNT